ncbi:hypothetical protein L3V82_06660 [Thiotrichales bacterium 19S3-7]|nr:hypothetical protein [Thiotrichales bacterium 19S3-7]MCF6801779.1 hypothetical protein [Thiotrichales bacterium 19S3-11]
MHYEQTDFMKYIYFLRLLVIFLFGNLYALAFIIVTLYGRHLLISPFELTIFPSMALGSLFCSFIPGERYLARWFKFRYALIATVVIAISLVALTLVAQRVEFVHYRSTSLIVICAMMGLCLGYLKAEYHVRLFQVITGKLYAVLAAMAFLLGVFSVYCFFYPMDVVFILIQATPNYSPLIISAIIIVLLLWLLGMIDQSIISNPSYYVTHYITETDNYHSEQVQLQLGFLSVLAIQIALAWGTTWAFYLQKVYDAEWLHRVLGNFRYAVFMMILAFAVILITGFLMWLLSKKFIFYLVQSVSLIITLGILITMVFTGIESEWLAKVSGFVLVAMSAMLLVVFQYYVILFFKGQLIRAFVPIAIGLSSFLMTIIWIATPILIMYSKSVLGFLVVTALALIFLFIVASISTFKRLDQMRLTYQRADNSLPS